MDHEEALERWEACEQESWGIHRYENLPKLESPRPQRDNGCSLSPAREKELLNDSQRYFRGL